MATAPQPAQVNQAPASEAKLGAEIIAERLARFEAEVAAGVRDARTLVLIPRECVVRAELSFPKDPYGAPQDW
jgi:hypothetical protein